jgi:hypothetical protein
MSAACLRATIVTTLKLALCEGSTTGTRRSHHLEPNSESSTMWIPDKLYKAMPALYAAGGVATALMFGVQSPSALSSFLLFAAAATTFSMRRKRPLIARQHRPGQAPAPRKR